MKQHISKFTFLACLLSLSACGSTQPSEFSVDRGAPERLIDTSSEVSTFSLTSKNSLSKLSKALSGEPVSKAVLKCSLTSSKCAQAKEMLERRSIPFKVSAEKGNAVLLTYEKVVVRDCNPRFADNTKDSSRNNHPAFGCAVSANIVQSVTDKKDFTNPSLLDYPDAEKAVSSYRKGYLETKTRDTSSGSDNGLKAK